MKSFIGFILVFVAFPLFIAGFAMALGGNWGSALLFLSPALTLLGICGVITPPGWAFERAHQGSKTVWLLVAIIGLIPPFGLIYFASWLIFGRRVEHAWATGDPASYHGYLARKAAVAAASASYQQGLTDGRHGG
jgi:hypothetical protein